MKHRRIPIILLTLALLLTLLPATALAAAGTGWNDDCRGNPTPSSSEYGKHNWVKQSEKAGKSCTSKGTAVYTCSYCGATATRETKAPGHKWGGWQTTKEATCTKNGVQTRKCSLCGETEIRETDKAAQLGRLDRYGRGHGLFHGHARAYLPGMRRGAERGI